MENEMTEPRKIPKDVAEKILKSRDALLKEDYEEAYHVLYSIANPDFDSIEPWVELEIAAGRQRTT